MWTVNLKFLPEDTFQSKGLAVGLLCAHLLLLLAFAHFRRAPGIRPYLPGFHTPSGRQEQQSLLVFHVYGI